MGGDGIDDSVSGSVKGRTFDLFAAALFTDLTPSKAEMEGDTIRFSYPATAWGTLECRVWAIDGSAPGMEFRFTRHAKATTRWDTSAPSFDLSRVNALWQPMVWQRRIFPSQSYMSLAFTCPIPPRSSMSAAQRRALRPTAVKCPSNPCLHAITTASAWPLHNPEGKVQPMLFAPVLGHAGSKMKPGKPFAFRMRLWVEEKPLNIAFQTMARNLYDFHDYRSNAISTLNNTIDNIIDYTLSPYSNFIDSLKGCSYSTDVPGSTKNVSSLNPLSVALVADDGELYRRRAYPIVEYMLSRKNTLFCLDTTQKVQSPLARTGGALRACQRTGRTLPPLGRQSPVLRYFAEEKYYKHKPVEKRIPGAGGSWYDALEMYRATGETAYLDHAKRQADIYIEKFIRTQPEKFQNAFFWNRYAPFYINLAGTLRRDRRAALPRSRPRRGPRICHVRLDGPLHPAGGCHGQQGRSGSVVLVSQKPRYSPDSTAPRESVPRMAALGDRSRAGEFHHLHRPPRGIHGAPRPLHAAHRRPHGRRSFSVTSPAAPSWDATPISRVTTSTPNARRLTRNPTFRCVRTTASASTRSTTTTSSRCCPSCTTIW